MKLKLFIDRPILASAISTLILLFGIIGFSQLPMEQYPDIAPPTVQVSATYMGASAQTVQRSVIAPLEESINGVENMLYMTSSATNTGSATINVYFKQGTNPDMATVNVQNRISKVQGSLPADVTKIGVTAQKRQNSMLMIFGLASPDSSYDQNFLNNYLKINVLPRLQRIKGVGDVMIMGSDYSMRIWLKPAVMAQYKLVPNDIINVLGEQNIEAPTGTLGDESSNTYQYPLKYRGRYTTSEEFGELVIRSQPDGTILKLKDVADVELGASSYSYKSQIKGTPGSQCMISQVAGSNANETILAIQKELKEIGKDLPKGMKIEPLMSIKDFLDASIHNVIETLIEAIILVIIVVYVFLQSVRSTIIPAVAILVSLVGTFACIYLAGFSINLLTLFALVLVIGTVVDDAIVVVEAVQAKFDAGYKSAYLATVDAMGDITSAIITTSLVFMAVFVPVSFMGGTSGTFYTQFGVTMAVAVAISTINALTLSPALCALFMTPHIDADSGQKLSFSSRFHIAFDASFNKIVVKYKGGIEFFIKRKKLVISLIVVALLALFVLMKTSRTGLVPDEDTGVLFVNITTPPGTTLEATQKSMDAVETYIKRIPQISSYSKITGYSFMSGAGSSAGMIICKLKPWDERKGKANSKDAVIGQIFGMTSGIKTASVFAFAPPMVTGYGLSNATDIYVQDRKGGSVEDLFKYTQGFIQELNKRPEIKAAYSAFDNRFPQYNVEVDAAKCKRAGVSPADVLSTLSGYIGGNYASNLNRFSKIYRVMVQAKPEYRASKESLDNIYVRTTNGDMAPISQFLTLTKAYGPASLTNFNMFTAINVSAMAADGYSSGDVINAVSEVSQKTLPAGYGYELAGLAREEASSGTATVAIFIICLIFVYLILCSLYESIFIPLAVMLSIPFGLMGCFIFARIFGIENNIYMQTGLIMLIGMLAKTAILVTEFASERRKHGMGIAEAALSAATVRFRPILMTALTMIIGLLPLAVATGAGANGNMSLGIGTVGGMLVGTLALLFVVPVLFIVFQTIEERLMPKRPEIEQYKHRGE